MKCTLKDFRVEEYEIHDARISFKIPKSALAELNGLTDKELEVSITRKKKRRSLNANAYCWVLCDKIARALNDGSTKEDIYRDSIEAVGSFEPMGVLPDKVGSFIAKWGVNGLGWIVKDTGQNVGEMRLVFAYYGSSTYTRDEMARLIDKLIDNAEQVGCTDILTPAERSLMLQEWRENAEKHQTQRSRDEGTAAAGT